MSMTFALFAHTAVFFTMDEIFSHAKYPDFCEYRKSKIKSDRSKGPKDPKNMTPDYVHKIFVEYLTIIGTVLKHQTSLTQSHTKLCCL